MGQLLVIVSKDKPELYDYLTRSYAMQDGVRVIMDRREHRTDEGNSPAEERRRQPNPNAELIYREAGAPPKPASAPRFTFADRDWTRPGTFRLLLGTASLSLRGLTP